MLDVRLATNADLPGVLSIGNRAIEQTAASFHVQPQSLAALDAEFQSSHAHYPWLVACDEAGGVIGFARASAWKGRCAYAWSAEVTVYVRPEHHGRGVGRALYERLIGTLQAQGYRTLLAGITLPNPPSVRLHESFGFRPAGEFRRVGYKFGRWHTVGYWQLELGDAAAPPGEIRPVTEGFDAAATAPLGRSR